MEFVEVPIFTSVIANLLDEYAQRELQDELLGNPARGNLIKGSGGLRKLRFSASGHGKRGGVRIIYYLRSESRIYLVFAYAKAKQEDMSPEQLKVLRQLVALIKEE